MSQTVNSQNTSETTLRNRPGQRQQERLQRRERRRRRFRLITGSIAAVLIIAAGITGTWLFQNYSVQQTAISNAHATATKTIVNAHATGTASFIANATATVVTKNCFLSPNAPSIPAIYTASTPPSAGPTTAPAISGTPVVLKDGLQYVDMKVGTGAVVKSGQTINVNYTGWVASTCQKFDSSFDSHTDQNGNNQPPAPFPAQLDTNSVISGWVDGIPGMKVGGIRRLYIPSALGYGTQGAGSTIPPNAILIFDVQVLSIQ